mgnify:CR=1 FL=1
MYGIRSLQQGGRPTPRTKPEQMARESFADYKMTPREQKFFASQDADTQVLIDSFLAEQQRGVDETELDMVVEQVAGGGKDPMAQLGYMKGEIYGVPAGSTVTNLSGMVEMEPGDLRDFVEQAKFSGANEKIFSQQFIPVSEKTSGFVDPGSRKSVNYFREGTGEGISPAGKNTLRHELSHIAFRDPDIQKVLGDLPNPYKEGPEEIYIRVKDYVLANSAGQEKEAEAAAYYLSEIGLEDPAEFFIENAGTFEKIENMAQQSIQRLIEAEAQSAQEQ